MLHCGGSIFHGMKSLLYDSCDLPSCPLLLRRFIICLCFLQPFVLLSVFIFKHSKGYETVDSSLQFLTTTIGKNGTNSTLEVEVGNIDYIFFCVPLCLSISFSSMLWVHYSHLGILNADVIWDETLDESLITYEFAYYVEVLAVFLSCMALISDSSPYIMMNMTVCATGVVCLLCVSAARYPTGSEIAESWLMMISNLMIIGLILIISIFICNPNCALSAAATLMMGIYFLLNGIGHLSARGRAAASSIVALRTMSSLVVCTFNLIVYASTSGLICPPLVSI
jgi:hypothetical protein